VQRTDSDQTGQWLDRYRWLADVLLSKSAAVAPPVRAAYAQSIGFWPNALISFVQTYGDPNLVMVDHQPWAIVSGETPNHNA
jgi:hypothetical protein